MKGLLSAAARPSAVLAAAALLCGCAGFSDLRETETFFESYSAGEYDAASAVVGGETGLDYPEGQLLSSLHSAMALRAAGRFDASQVAFDRAESQLLWKSDSIASVEDLLAAGLTVVGNDLMVSYRGTIYDGVMVNTYKATNAVMIGDTARARVELNRAHQRQANAVDQLAAKVQALRAQEEDEDEHRESIDRSLGEAMEPDGAVARRLKAVESLGAYRDLRNPFTDWLHGAFRLATGEANRASDLFRNAAALDGARNRHVLADFAVAERAASGTAAAGDRVWVVHEDGTGPYLRQFRFDLPVFLDRDSFLIVSMALPDLRPGTSASGPLRLSSGGEDYRTETLLNVDRYAATEFRAGYDAVVGKAVAGTVIRTLLQIAVQEETRDAGTLGSIIGFVTPIAAAVVTQADTRIWRALPHSIGIASLPRPADGRIRVTAADHTVDVRLPSGRFVLVQVKTIVRGAPPTVHTAAFGG